MSLCYALPLFRSQKCEPSWLPIKVSNLRENLSRVTKNKRTNEIRPWPMPRDDPQDFFFNDSLRLEWLAALLTMVNEDKEIGVRTMYVNTRDPSRVLTVDHVYPATAFTE